MRNIRNRIFTGILFMSAGCAQDNMSKDKLVNDCLKNFTKRNETEKRFTQVQLGLLCDCMADKFIAKYKSMKEADKDPEGAQQIGRECGEKLLRD